ALPRNSSRTSTQAISVPVTASIPATTSDARSVSFSAENASAAEIESQKAPSPPLPDIQTIAAIGSRTIRLRYVVTRPKPSARPDGARSTGSGRVAALASDAPDLLLDLRHDSGLGVEELLLDLVPAAQVPDVEEAGSRRELELVADALHHRPVARLGEERLRLRRVQEVQEGSRGGLVLPRRDRHRVLDQDRPRRVDVV